MPVQRERKEILWQQKDDEEEQSSGLPEKESSFESPPETSRYNFIFNFSPSSFVFHSVVNLSFYRQKTIYIIHKPTHPIPSNIVSVVTFLACCQYDHFPQQWRNSRRQIRTMMVQSCVPSRKYRRKKKRKHF